MIDVRSRTHSSESRQKSVVVTENIDTVRKLIKQDRFVMHRQIEGSLYFTITSINKILHEHLEVKEKCSCWIPHNLTHTQTETHQLMQ